MRKLFIPVIAALCILCSCHSANKVQQVVVIKDTATTLPAIPVESHVKEDSAKLISEMFKAIQDNHIFFTTFSAKIDVDYENSEGKKYNVNGHLRMQKDSVIWLSVTAILGIEGLRLYITPDSVKMLDKQNKVYTAKGISYLEDIIGLPLNFATLEDLLVGNPVFFDAGIKNYTKADNTISLVYENEYIRNLLTIGIADKLIQSSRLEEIDGVKKRTSELTYADYKPKKEIFFPEKRNINIRDTTTINVWLDFKQYEFNEKLSFPFSVPKNYSRN